MKTTPEKLAELKAKKMALDARILGMQCNPLYSLNHGKGKPGRKT